MPPRSSRRRTFILTMLYTIFSKIYLISLVFACISSVYRYRKLDSASRVLCVFVCCALLNESVAYYLARKYHNNLPLYNIYCFIEFGILCLYFNKLIDMFIKKNIGIYIGISGIILGILNLRFVQGINTVNSYFLFLEGLLVIGMALFAFFRLLLKHDSLHFSRYHHFWFLTILIFFWSITFLAWGLYDYINMKFHDAAGTINFTLTVVSAITYGCLGLVFLFYPKMQRSND